MDTDVGDGCVNKLLARLKPLEADEYFIALGSGGRCFFGSPNGYAA